MVPVRILQFIFYNKFLKRLSLWSGWRKSQLLCRRFFCWIYSRRIMQSQACWKWYLDYRNHVYIGMVQLIENLFLRTIKMVFVESFMNHTVWCSIGDTVSLFRAIVLVSWKWWHHQIHETSWISFMTALILDPSTYFCWQVINYVDKDIVGP